MARSSKRSEAVKLKAYLNGNRSTGASDGKDMRLLVEDENSGLVVAEIVCTPEALMRGITGQQQPIEITVWTQSAELWGKTHEHKREDVDLAGLDLANWPECVMPQVKALEVDGWKADYLGSDGSTRSTGFNSHMRSRTADGADRYQVIFRRYV